MINKRYRRHLQMRSRPSLWRNARLDLIVDPDERSRPVSNQAAG
jgi:hypothetical protein